MSSKEPEEFRLGGGSAATPPSRTKGRSNATGVEPSTPAKGEPASSTNDEAAAEVSGTMRSFEDVKRLGANLAQTMLEDGYHPVILFGTNFSGKTSLLLSLFAAIKSDPDLDTGLALCNPILGSSTLGSRLHNEAVHTFEVKTQAFLEGEKIPKTAVALPFFIPVELRPLNKPPSKFAFLESNGEWYRPKTQRRNNLNLTTGGIHQGLRQEIEDFIATYQGGITFIYLLPYTQGEVYSDRDAAVDGEELRGASLAIAGVLAAYDKIRASHRESDQHLLLVTKWDAHNPRDTERADAIREDREAVQEFCQKRYGQALAAANSLQVEQSQRHLNAYCAGLINERGRIPSATDDEVGAVVQSYPLRLWRWLYMNDLHLRGLSEVSPFREPPPANPLLVAWRRLLDLVSGHS